MIGNFLKTLSMLGIAWAGPVALAGPEPTHASWQPVVEAVEVHYTGDKEQEVDLFAADAPSYSQPESLPWKKVATGSGLALADRSKPVAGNHFRFYRVAPHDGSEGPSATVIAYRALDLKAGENWVGLWGNPSGSSLLSILGRYLPAGSNPDESTRVTWYSDEGYPEIAQRVWLESGKWPTWKTMDGAPANNVALPPSGALTLHLPLGAGSRPLHVGLPVAKESRIVSTLPGKYHPFSVARPGGVKLSESGLLEAGFTARAFSPTESDEIRVFKNGEGASARPEVRILLDPADGTFKYWTGGKQGASAADYLLEPGMAPVLYTGVSPAPWQWHQP